MDVKVDPLRGRTILVVEADRAISNLVRDELDSAGYRCVPASDGRLALELARDERPCLISLDRDLPDTDGHAVLHGLLGDESTRDIPIVVISGYGRLLPICDQHLLAGMLDRPVDVSSLTGTVRAVLRPAGA